MDNSLFSNSGIILQWHITERCNQNCIHCYHDNSYDKELDFSQLLEIVDQFKHFLDQNTLPGHKRIGAHINITGGEPFIRDDFIKLLEVFSLNKDYFGFAILSNASLIDFSTAKYLKKLGTRFIQVSIDGSKSTHDKIRGDGNFDKTISAIKLLNKAKLRTVVSFTASKKNYNEFSEVVKISRKIKVHRVWSDRFLPIGNSKNAKNEVLSASETHLYNKLLNQERIKCNKSFFNKTEVTMHRALQFIESGEKPYKCSAGNKLITILANGDLCPCRRMPIPVGNLMKNTINELYYTSELFKKLRSETVLPEKCNNCIYSKVCAGGLKCLAYAITGDPFSGDPGCWLRN